MNFAILECDERILENLSNMLKSILVKHDFDAKIGLSTSNIDNFLKYAKTTKIDVVILAIELNSSLTGLEIAEKIRKLDKDCYIIFETYYLEYALLAYKYKTFDFICKPISYIKLENSIIRLFDDLSSAPKNFIKLDNKNTIIAQNEIKYIEKFGTKLVFHTDYKDYESYNSFSRIQNVLPKNFVRCHRSFIANIDNITRIEATENKIYFSDLNCYIGPKYKNSFLEVFNKYENLS